MDRLPLDARLLSNAVIELNIARHILTLYAREHQLVQLSLDKTFAIFADLFELRPEITLAVAKDTLIIDGHLLDPRNPVFREFALALSRMSVAFVSFVKGVTRQEVCDFFRFLARDSEGISSDTLPEILTEYQMRHILIQPLDYRTFAFVEDKAEKDGPDAFLLDRHIKALLDGGLPASGVRQVLQQVEPAALAALLNQADHEIARSETYDTVVSSYLRGGAGKPFSGGDLDRLLTFIAGLRPELKRQFLASSVKAISSDPAALSRALEGVSVDGIIDFFGEVDRSRLKVPEALSTLIARFARTGVELPGGGLNVDDVLISREIVSLFKEEEGHQHGPESYQAEIRKIVETSDAAASGPAGAAIDHELDADYVRYCHANALFALLESPLPELITFEDQNSYANVFIALANQSVGAGQYAQLLELLTRLEDLEGRGRHPDVVRAAREYCLGAGFIAGLVDSLRRHGRADRGGAALVCTYYGGQIVAPLFDLLAVEGRTHVRKMLLQLLIGLGEHVVREAPLQLLDKRWHVRRNMLYVLAESGARYDPGTLLPFGKDEDARVRLECARCLVRAGHAAGVGILRALLRDPTDSVGAAAIAAAGALGVQDLLPDLLALAKKPARSTGIRQRLRVVRTLGQLGSEPAAAALRELLGTRISLFPAETKRFRSEVRKVLQRLAAKLSEGTKQGASPTEDAR